ncbi:hypothetical protein DSM106972_072280 [Dulcicalothrix desertica PCC 7102]|uniref:Filamentous haemagglutinin FhaB/tRNA nuclease CdiA-like TPS domain-containing protein n=1 Tax=Dulcicalothrix desertica PCC 7102 TaxID=232991 RepID=A0A3S1CZH4_9CYAN|nr:filamentous hemagglutinin N-terminal domain-containing protein [Dulcicalothrix desertica]RUT00819.1 hypothetical protein DSM106972_072280 [Dulcicalothrix desertica PCC 7102]TWH42341.1 filamentous hemagglutinin family protein [Dulcicalothrix desertica PCC 7102]
MKNVGLGSIIWRLSTSLLIGCVSAFTTSISSSFAQSNIVPDETLGTAESSRVIPNFNGAANDAIIGGAERGQNLFHSLREFGVSENRGAYFLTFNANIQNIFARVTGSNPSEIFGTLGVRQALDFTPSTANLYLMNPNGVLFGQNANLDLGGSFVVTTASGIQFGERGVYNASGGQPADVLTINPSAFLFNQISRGNITNRSVAPAGKNLVGESITGLRVPDGKSLLFLGGDINIEGGGLSNPPFDGSGGLRAYNGRIELGSLAAPGIVGLNIAGDSLSFNIPEGVERGNISITNGAEINVRGSGGGDIAFTAKDVNVSGIGIVRAGIDNKLGSPTTFAGDIQINATGTVTLTDENSRISNVLDGEALGKSGNVNIVTGSLIISNDAILSTDTFGIGDAGNISILADKVLVNDGLIGSSVQSRAIGNGGNIFIKVNDAVSLIDAVVDSNIESGAVGSGGTINIEAGSLSITDSTQIQTFVRTKDNEQTPGIRNGGNVNINVRGAVNISGIKDGIPSGIRSTLTGVEGKAGNITINAGSLNLTDKAGITSGTFGTGNAGNISIQVNDLVALDDSGIFSNVGDGAVGNGGDISIKSDSLSLVNSSVISAQVNAATANFPGGKGNGGNINIDVTGKVTFAQAQPSITNGIVNVVGVGAVGNGGNITINAGSLEVTGGSEIQGSTRGKGNSGAITINARDTIRFDGSDGGNIFSRAINSVQLGAEGNAGGIKITTGSLFLTNGAIFSSSTNGIGNGGDINIDARNLISLDRVADISNNVFDSGRGKAGNTFIQTGSLFLTNGSQISADVSGKGDSGNIIVNARDAIKLDSKIDSAASSIRTGILRNAEGKPGNIQITTGSLLVSNGADISTSTVGIGDAGNITINASDTITFEGFDSKQFLPSGARSTVASPATGNGGTIRITGKELFLKNSGQINASSFGTGGSGNIFVNIKDAVNIDGVSPRDGTSSGIISLMSGTTGKGGDIQVTTESLSATNGGILANFGQGEIGDIVINARDSVKFDGAGNGLGSGASSVILPDKQGSGGDIKITTGLFTISNGANISSQSSGIGDGGNIFIDARDNISLINNVIINASTSGQGNGGSITINAGNSIDMSGVAEGNQNPIVISAVLPRSFGRAGDLQLSAKKLSLNNAAILNSTLGTGDAGNIFLKVSEDISMNRSFVDSSVFSGGIGKGGNLDIETKNLTLTNGSGISAGVSRSQTLANTLLPAGNGRGGNIRINASDSINISGIGSTGASSTIATLTERGASGDAGDVSLTTKNFRATDGAVVSSATFNDSKGGEITINADIFELFNGAQILGNTRSSGNAGNISLNIKDRITISGSDPNFNQRLALAQENLGGSGSNTELTDVVTNEGAASGLFANTAPGSTGNGGSIIIDPREFIISDSGRISVNSEGTGTAGNISVTGGNLTLDKASITARSASRDGGNIKFTLSDKLVLRRNSEISTTAGTAGAGGNGGNIDINAKFVVAIPKENSNINANAFEGNGGRVQINTQGIFGIGFSPQETELSDITVSSQFGVSGVADINSPNNSFIPNNLTELNKDTIDTNAIIATSCIARDKKSGTFYVRGSGGFSARPGNAPLSTYSTGTVSNLPETQERRPWKKGDSIVEPQGMYQLPNGKIFMGNECSET